MEQTTNNPIDQTPEQPAMSTAYQEYLARQERMYEIVHDDDFTGELTEKLSDGRTISNEGLAYFPEEFSTLRHTSNDILLFMDAALSFAEDNYVLSKDGETYIAMGDGSIIKIGIAHGQGTAIWMNKTEDVDPNFTLEQLRSREPLPGVEKIREKISSFKDLSRELIDDGVSMYELQYIIEKLR